MATSWESTASQKRQEIFDQIPAEWRIKNPSIEEQVDVTGAYIEQYLTDEETTITNADAVGIADHVASRKWTAVDVIKAFSHRAAIAHQLTNCLLEIFFDAGLRQAEALDEHLAKTGKTIGPLHGVPVSLKDQFHVKGVETSMGYVGWIGTFQGKKGTGKERVFESEMVKELRNCGAVLYCKTSVPHTLMMGESNNHIVGYCWNSKNRNISSGGSSGGEGSLIGCRGSPLGFGTDIGGSVRIPAAANGLYGLRPSVGRMPYEGMANSMDGQNSVLSVVGPMATTARSIKLVFQAILSQKPWYDDPLVLEIPWRSAVAEEYSALASKAGGRSLCFGVIRNDGTVTPHPPISRALAIVVETLKQQGHEIVEWDTSLHEKVINLTQTTWGYDAGADISQAFALSGEPAVPGILKPPSPPPPQFNATQIAETNIGLREVKKEYLEMWNQTVARTSSGRPIDAIIAPVAPFPAARPGKYKYYGYSNVFNGLDYSSIVVPVTNADRNIDKVRTSFKAQNELDEEVQGFYDPEIYHGATACIQIVGRRLEEEKVIVLAEYLGGLLRPHESA